MTRRARPTRCRPCAPAGRGFTLVEVMLALALSAIVISAAIGLYRILHVAERTGEARFEQAADLAVTQIMIRKIMNTLVSAPPEPQNNRITGTPEPEDEPDEGADEAAQTEEDQPKEPEDRASIFAEAAPSTPIMFDLWWEEVEADRGSVTVPMLEIVVSEPPIALTSASERVEAEEDLERVEEDEAEEVLRRANRLSETVRGVLEVVPDYDGWRLQWRPLRPAGKPFPLVSRIASAEDGGPALMWEVLSRDEKNTDDAWKMIWAAKVHDEFPQAVRLFFTTTDNQYTDWLFETHDAVQE